MATGAIPLVMFFILFQPSASSLPLITKLVYGKFPQDFIWGVASSNYQMEGAVWQDGKGESVWDRFVHTHPDLIMGNATADVADNSYNLWREDIEQLKLMGMKYYRISIAWVRILPNGTADGGINMKALKHYRSVFEDLVNAGITPIVTICHYDLPQALQNRGGWLNSQIIDWYTDYARICFESYGDIIKYWITFNSPGLTSNLLLETVLADTKMTIKEISECLGSCQYRWVHQILLAHQKAWHLYDDVYRKSQHGVVGIIADSEWFGPGSEKPEDIAASNRAIEFELGWVLHPVIKGDYPKVMKDTIDRRSRNQGLAKSRLPEFSQHEIDALKGTYDFVGLNTYTAFNIFDASGLNDLDTLKAMLGLTNSTLSLLGPFAGLLGSYNITLSFLDREISLRASKDWPLSGDGFRRFTPWAMKKLLKWIKDNYDNPPIMITENGWADTNGSIFDPWRVDFFEQSINNVLQAHLDGCNIKGYIAWAFLDAFEWQGGYMSKMGLIRVDQNDPARKRYPKLSSRYFGQLAKNNGFLPPEVPYLAQMKQKVELILGESF